MIGEQVSSKPQIIFRRAPNIRDLVTSSYIKTNKKKCALTVGFYNCGKCRACTDSGTLGRKRIKKEFVLPDGLTSYKLKDFSTCNTEGVIYIIECPCGKRYIGRTCRKLKTRIREHWRNIRLGILTHNLSTHYKEYQKPEGSSFWVLEVVRPWWRGENTDLKLSRKEGEWIYKLNTLVPDGLNIDLELKCFLKD